MGVLEYGATRIMPLLHHSSTPAFWAHITPEKAMPAMVQERGNLTLSQRRCKFSQITVVRPYDR
jgi:hypothetical protein